jgi:uncharacterized protein (DUF433 family)
MTIVRDPEILGGEPRIEGTRIGVRHVAARVIDTGRSPAYVADQFDLSLAEMYDALSYYYAHTDEIREHRSENDDAFERVRDETLRPKEHVS